MTDRVGVGTVFIPMYFAAGAVNELTQEAFDPTSGIPEYKVASVPIEGIDEDGASVDVDTLRPPGADDGAGNGADGLDDSDELDDSDGFDDSDELDDSDGFDDSDELDDSDGFDDSDGLDDSATSDD